MYTPSFVSEHGPPLMNPEPKQVTLMVNSAVLVGDCSLVSDRLRAGSVWAANGVLRLDRLPVKNYAPTAPVCQ
jgi:hypothetical protein